MSEKIYGGGAEGLGGLEEPRAKRRECKLEDVGERAAATASVSWSRLSRPC